MGITVKTFDEKELKDAIDKSPKIIRDYIKAQRNIIENGKDLQREMLNKIRELSKKLNEG